MTYTLTVEERSDIIDQHLRSLAFKKYNLEVSLLEEESAQIPNQGAVEDLNKQLLNANAQIVALAEEKESLV
jgi:hypothetical protein